MADQEQYQGGQGQEERTPRGYQQYPQRSTASFNWRSKDDAPRAEPQPRQQRQSGQFGSPRTFGGQQRETSDTRLYVGNLLYSATKDDIAQFFTANGFTLTNLSMSIDPETGRNPSYCFADFGTAEEASRAMAELNGQDVMGRAVRINPGVAKKQGFGEQSDSPRQYGSTRSYGQQDGSKPQYERTPYSRPEGQSRPQYNTREESSGPGKRLYIGNLPGIDPQSAVEDAIHTLFDPLGIELTNVSNLRAPHESKASEPGDHHYCFVDLARPEDIDAAIEALDGKPPSWGGESTLRVNKAREQTQRRYGQREGGEGGYRGGYQGGQREGGEGGYRGGYQGGQREGGEGGYRGGYQGRRQEGNRDWRTAAPRQEAGQ